MKKLLSIGMVSLFALSLTACGGGTTNGENITKKTSENTSSSKKMNREEGERKLMEISEKIMNGKITPEEAKKQKKEITDNMESKEESMKRINDNMSDFDGMPSWAKSANISEPKGLTLVVTESSITKEKGAYPDGFATVYEGSLEILTSEAKRITKELGLKIDMEDVASGTFMASGEVAGKYMVSMTVINNDKETKMLYAASDMTEQKKLREKYNK